MADAKLAVRKQRDDWVTHRQSAVSAQADCVVFIDETSVKTTLTHQRGWSLRGKRLVKDAAFGSWVAQTFVAGLSADALIAPWVIKGAMYAEAFAAYVTQVVVPEVELGMAVILDNLPTHKNVATAKAIGLGFHGYVQASGRKGGQFTVTIETKNTGGLFLNDV